MVGEAAGRRGTEIAFLPSPAIFADTKFDFAVLENGFREFARPESDITLVLTDRRSPQGGRVLLTL
jgi:DNA gyrase subunit B